MKAKICLNMIVKNETPVLGRLFDSVKDIIDYYIIADTGSTDGTPEFIRQEMERHGIPGEVLHHKWVNYGFNRNQALQHVYVKKTAGVGTVHRYRRGAGLL
jgi:glycosyltransferase involved in cell wall biosynthesis